MRGLNAEVYELQWISKGEKLGKVTRMNPAGLDSGGWEPLGGKTSGVYESGWLVYIREWGRVLHMGTTTRFRKCCSRNILRVKTQENLLSAHFCDSRFDVALVVEAVREEFQHCV